MKEYSELFERAYRQPYQRQEYLSSLIDGTSISQANLRLAHLLLGEEVGLPPLANVVVTPNFDDLLTRALTLFGKPHVVCDHPGTSLRIHQEQHDVLQVVHVHGTHRSYDCVNLVQEIERTARPDGASTQTMAALLDRLFHSRALLVVGYSGWESDVIMQSLKRRLNEPLRFNLYWFCYRRSHAERLPEWLRDHPAVYFVVPRRASGGGKARHSRRADADRSEMVEPTLTDDKGDEPTLPALDVFDRLLAELGAAEPAITQSPIRFFADQLERSVPHEDLEVGGGLYQWRRVIDEVRTKQEGEPPDEGGASPDDLQAMVGAVRRANYGHAVDIGLRLAERYEADGTDADGTLSELLQTLHTAALKIPASEEQLAAFEVVGRLYISTDAELDGLDEEFGPRWTEALSRSGTELAARSAWTCPGFVDGLQLGLFSPGEGASIALPPDSYGNARRGRLSA